MPATLPPSSSSSSPRKLDDDDDVRIALRTYHSPATNYSGVEDEVAIWGRNLLICRQKGDDKKHELYCHTSCDPESVFPLKSLAELPCFPLRRMFVFPINSIPSRMVSSCWLCIRKEPYHHFISSHLIIIRLSCEFFFRSLVASKRIVE